MKNPYYSYNGGGDAARLNTEHEEEIENVMNIRDTQKKDINKEHEKEIKGTLKE
ncbi:hypothetical protein L195_g033570, partial [Trifolium pratense]